MAAQDILGGLECAARTQLVWQLAAGQAHGGVGGNFQALEETQSEQSQPLQQSEV